MAIIDEIMPDFNFAHVCRFVITSGSIVPTFWSHLFNTVVLETT